MRIALTPCLSFPDQLSGRRRIRSLDYLRLVTVLYRVKYGFQFGLIPPLFFAGVIFKGNIKAKFAIGIFGTISFALLGYLSYDLPANYVLPAEHGIWVLMANLIVPICGPTFSTIASLVYAEHVEDQLEEKHKENEKLLLNILPAPMVDKLKKENAKMVSRYDHVSILFADLVNFTPFAEQYPPQEVVDILNGLFSLFDSLTEKYEVEKIKTIGDAYMVASGVPLRKEDHAKVLFLFAQEMLIETNRYNKKMDLNLQLRIGISSGSVVAGVIGKKKFSYDLWGDTVNTAARMESNGQIDKIQVSNSTYLLLKDAFSFERIPKLEIKGKGKVDVFVWGANDR